MKKLSLKEAVGLEEAAVSDKALDKKVAVIDGMTLELFDVKLSAHADLRKTLKADARRAKRLPTTAEIRVMLSGSDEDVDNEPPPIGAMLPQTFAELEAAWQLSRRAAGR